MDLDPEALKAIYNSNLEAAAVEGGEADDGTSSENSRKCNVSPAVASVLVG